MVSQKFVRAFAGLSTVGDGPSPLNINIVGLVMLAGDGPRSNFERDAC
jgi:hypothetical protein